jgi:hypothetical protein
MHRDRGDTIAASADRFDALLAEVVPHEILVAEHKLRRHEPDVIAAAQEHVGVAGARA